ncbi:hypothetical protein MYX65_04990, partial [Acidobacteria bacterium AH-259-L09]|nr:hypothetical protein [Acidobacteria bacterium AH-259-L09]
MEGSTNNHHKTKDQLIKELAEARQRIVELQAVESEHKQAEEKLESSNTEFTRALARALKLRDQETEGHAERVAEMTVRLARPMGVS